MRWPLRYQILTAFSCVMLAALVGLSVLSAVMAASQTKQKIEGQIASLAQTLRGSTFKLNDTVLLQMSGLSGAQFVLTGADNQVLGQTIHWPEGLEPVAPAPADQFRLGPTVTTSDGVFFYTPIGLRREADDGEPLVLHIFYPEQTWRQTRWEAMAPPLIAGGATLALTSLVAFVLSRRLTRPIGQLRTQVERLAQGAYEPIPLPSRDDELRDLVSSVNSLALQLDDLEQAIQRTERFALLGQLSGGLAHHLRNTVTGARMAVQLHQRQCHDIDQDSLGVALRQLSLTEEHLQRFLAAGKPSTPRRVDCDLTQIVLDLAPLVAPACQHRKIDFQIQGASDPLPLCADPDQLRQALLNLVLNAVDAAGAGGWIRIELGRLASGMVIARVVDGGPGPQTELVERLFEAFVTSKPEGVGLGLAVARQVAVAHDGALEYIPGGPTTFELRLPVERTPRTDKDNTSNQPADRANPREEAHV